MLLLQRQGEGRTMDGGRKSRKPRRRTGGRGNSKALSQDCNVDKVFCFSFMTSGPRETYPADVPPPTTALLRPDPLPHTIVLLILRRTLDQRSNDRRRYNRLGARSREEYNQRQLLCSLGKECQSADAVLYFRSVPPCLPYQAQSMGSVRYRYRLIASLTPMISRSSRNGNTGYRLAISLCC
jgi:hypothetical protein